MTSLRRLRAAMWPRSSAFSVSQRCSQRNESPFGMGQLRTPDEWYYRPSVTRPYMLDRLFDEPAVRGHVQVFAWFCGATATALIGDTIRRLIRLMYLSVLKNRTLHEELADVILSSLLFHSMNPLEQKHVFTMMLKAAIVYGRLGVVRYLVSHGADSNDPEVLRWCAVCATPESLEAVTASGGMWILYPFVINAVTRSKFEAAEFMIRQGMDAQAKITGENGPLHIAAERGDGRMVKILLEQGFVDVNARGLDGITPLMKAARPKPSKWGKNGLETVEILLEWGANVHLCDSTGRTALHGAYGNVLALLLAHGVDPNTQDNNGTTPLNVIPERVTLAQYEDRLEMMLAAGADPHMKDRLGRSPYDVITRTERGQSFVEAHREYFQPRC